MKRQLTIMTFAINMLAASATTFYCKPNGTDDGSSYDKAGEFTTLVSKLQAGDILYCLGGQYDYSSRISLSVSGTAGKYVCIYAYGQEKPVFDFRTEAYGSTGISTSGDYVHMKGLTIRYSGKNGLLNTGGYCIFELLDVYGNGDTGVQMKGAAGHNLILNCDSHDNFDYKLDKSGNLTEADFGGNADGFADKQYTGEGNTYKGCRSWRNSDDGWDCYQRVTSGSQTVIDSCIVYQNGPYTYDMRNHPRYNTDKEWFDQFAGEGKTVTTRHGTTRLVTLENYANEGNANGFKMGGDYTQHNFTVRQCLAVGNNAKGLDQNNNDGVMYWFNNTLYDNVINVGMNNLSYGNATLYNNIDLKGTNTTSENELNSKVCIHDHNTFDIEGLQWSSDDFESIDTTLILSPRQSDGSLAETKLFHLKKGSLLINAGTMATGLPFYGAAPDLGCYESKEGGQHIPPTLTVTGSKNLSVKAGRPISSVTVTAGGSVTGISRTDNTVCPGVNVTIDGLKATITGTPTVPGSYVFTFVPVTEIVTSLSVTITLTVSDATADVIGYISNGTSGTNPADAKMIEALEKDFDLRFFDAASTSNDYSDCDALIISPVPSSTAAGMSALKDVKKPVLLLKPWMMKNTVWNFGTAANIKSTTVFIKSPQHPIFDGITVTDNTLPLFTKITSSLGVSVISSSYSWSNYTLLATPSSDSGQIAIADLSGATLNGTTYSQRYIMIGVHEASTANLTEAAQQLIRNSVYYILGQDVPTQITCCGVGESIAPAVYYDMLGRQISSPEKGMYIVKQGNKVTKVVK